MVESISWCGEALLKDHRIRSLERRSDGFRGSGVDSADSDQEDGGDGRGQGASLEAVAQRAQRGGYCSPAVFQGAFRTAAQQLLRRVACMLPCRQPGNRSGRSSLFCTYTRGRWFVIRLRFRVLHLKVAGCIQKGIMDASAL